MKKSGQSESLAHAYLKQRAVEVLKNEFGFQDNEIIVEYKTGDYRIDVVGISGKLKVAIEVGRIHGDKQRKLAYLAKHFDIVRRLPFTGSIHPRTLFRAGLILRHEIVPPSERFTIRIRTTQETILAFHKWVDRYRMETHDPTATQADALNGLLRLSRGLPIVDPDETSSAKVL